MKKIIPIILFTFIGCNEHTATTAQKEQQRTEENQAHLLKNQPPIKLDFSLERENINQRTLRGNDAYFLCDKPLKMSTAPQLVIQENNDAR